MFLLAHSMLAETRRGKERDEACIERDEECILVWLRKERVTSDGRSPREGFEWAGTE